jgi:hypothetical protein
VEKTRISSKNIFGDLCLMLGEDADFSASKKPVADANQVFMHNPLERDYFSEVVKLRNKPKRSYIGLTKEDADLLWESLVFDVYPTLNQYTYSKTALPFFDNGLIHPREFLDNIAELVCYFIYGTVPGLGATSKNTYKEKELPYQKNTFGPDNLKRFNVSIKKLESETKALGELPINVGKAIYIIKNCSKIISKELELNRARTPYAQRALLILSIATGLKYTQISKAIYSDLEKAGFILRKNSVALNRRTLELKNKISRVHKLRSDDQLLSRLIDIELKKGGGSKNTFIFEAAKSWDLDLGEI